jgi:hypothetical protein
MYIVYYIYIFMNPPITPQSLMQQIVQIQHMERGRLCPMGQGPEGPYYNHQAWEHGKNVSRYIPRDQVAAMQEAIAGYERFQNLMDQYVQLIIQKTRAELAAGVKKKSSHPTSSWRKTRKSNS